MLKAVGAPLDLMEERTRVLPPSEPRALRLVRPFWPRRPLPPVWRHPLTGGSWPSEWRSREAAGHLAAAFRSPGSVEPGPRRTRRHRAFPLLLGRLAPQFGIGKRGRASAQDQS